MNVKSTLTFIVALIALHCHSQNQLTLPKPHQLKWHEAELGAVFHFDLHA